jgi:hypothetical protein
MPNSNSLIVWLVRGLGGLVNMIASWTESFGNLPQEQRKDIGELCKKLKSLIE